jgi:hypothetical protein
MIQWTRKHTALTMTLFVSQLAFGGSDFKFEKVNTYWPVSCNIQEMSLRKDSRTFAVACLHAVSGRISKAYLKDQTRWLLKVSPMAILAKG